MDTQRAAECFSCADLVAFRRQIGEAPGADEDLAGEGFVGQAGKKLASLLADRGLERRRDYGVANLIRCRPPENRKPTKGELRNCLGGLASFLLQTRPKVLLLVGGSAAEEFLGMQPLSVHIERSKVSAEIRVQDAHPALQEAIRTIQQGGVIHAIPMPHTSGLAWNRKAPDGRMWREIGAEQISLAVSLLSP